MACPHCGSSSVRADRSLAGRLVCGRCGRPLTAGRAGRSGRARRSGRGRWRWLLVLLALGAVLAWWAEAARRPAGPRPGTHGQSLRTLPGAGSGARDL